MMLVTAEIVDISTLKGDLWHIYLITVSIFICGYTLKMELNRDLKIFEVNGSASCPHSPLRTVDHLPARSALICGRLARALGIFFTHQPFKKVG